MGEIDYLAASVYLLNIGRSLMEPGCEALPLTKAHFGGERWRHLGWGQVDILGPEVSPPRWVQTSLHRVTQRDAGQHRYRAPHSAHKCWRPPLPGVPRILIPTSDPVLVPDDCASHTASRTTTRVHQDQEKSLDLKE